MTVRNMKKKMVISMAEKTVFEIYNNYMKSWQSLLNSNTKIVEKYGYSKEDAEMFAMIITAKILERW